MLIKLSNDLVTKLGATDAASALSTITALADNMSKPITETAAAGLDAAALTSFETRFAALEKQVTELSASGLTVAKMNAAIEASAANTLAAATKAATTEGSRAACSALAATGTNPLRAAVVEETTEATDGQALAKAGKFEEQWQSDEKLHAEFPTAGSYSGYMRALKGGHVAANLRN